MERLNAGMLNQARTSGPGHPPAPAGSFFHPFPAISLINGFGRKVYPLAPGQLITG